MKKRIFCLFIAICLLLPCVGCSSEPVAFSESLRNNRNCYIDVVEIQPASKTYVDYYCRCVLADGSTVWMLISQTDYETYFYPKASDDYSDYALGVKYDAPVRLTGKVEKTENTFDDERTDKKIKVFEFVEADTAVTLQGASYMLTGEEFKSDIAADRFVYADIVYVCASVYRGISFGGLSFFSSVILSCTTTSGETIDMLIDVTDYQEIFDKSAKFEGYSLFAESPDDLYFAIPLRIGGLSVKAADKFSSTAYGDKIIFEFTHADKEEVKNALVENQPAIPFSNSALPKQEVYVTLKSITPLYSISNLAGYVLYDLLCQAETVDGQTVWICMSYTSFKDNFLNTFVESDWSNIKVELENAVVYGRIEHSDDIANDLEDKIGKQNVIVFKKRV